ncbi:MAG: phosphotransferase [Rectinemataceae bacterium]|nr:phosphotransferase [Rectinemataceae bacterium]
MTADRALFDPKADSPAADEYLHALKVRYQAIDIHALALHTLEETLGIAPVAVRSLGGGENAMDHVLLLVEAVYKGEHKEFVVRVNTSPVPEPRLLLEARLYALWQSKGVPTPRVYGVRLRTQTYPYDYMVRDKVGDLNFETYRRSRYNSVATTRSVGAFLANLHDVPLHGFGPFASGYADGHLVGVYDSWEEAIREDVEGTLGYLERAEIINAETAERSKRTFEQYKSLLTLPKGVLLHGDFHPANVLVYADTGLVAGAVDLSQAKVGDPLFDIAFYGTYDIETFSEFMTGYAEVRPLPEDSRERLALYSLRILMSKAKLRKRFGYEDRIAAAIVGMEDALRVLG